MLASQFNSRTGYAALKMNHGDEAYLSVAIDNWLGASPIYTQRMQRAMGFSGGTDVATIFKGLQLECGMTHQYFDAHFEVFSEDKGRFWMESCGPLLETEPRGDEAVKVMCHDIEDPTFDGTAIATNPLARMRPIHRPPRKPDATGPHCEWSVTIEHQAEPLSESEITGRMRRSKLADVEILRPDRDLEPGGMAYYDGSVFEQLQLEQLSHAALVVVCKELAVQVQLLIRGMLIAITDQYGVEAASTIGEFQMVGSSWVMSDRLCRWLHCSGAGIDALMRVIPVHPAFQPCEYQQIKIEQIDARRIRLEFLDGPALQEQDAFSWMGLLQRGHTSGLEALVQGVDPRARCVRDDENKLAWEIIIDPTADPVNPPLPVQIAMGTVLYQTRLEDHLQLLQIQE
jgi:hypothetical protein